MTTMEVATWTDVCAEEALHADRGVAALIGGYQVALFKVGAEGELFAVSNLDPFSRSYVISRGIVGTKGGSPKVASPMYKQTFDLRTGVCFEDPTVQLATYEVRVVDGRVQVAVPERP